MVPSVCNGSSELQFVATPVDMCHSHLLTAMNCIRDRLCVSHVKCVNVSHGFCDHRGRRFVGRQ
jgi:hypothetical protein